MPLSLMSGAVGSRALLKHSSTKDARGGNKSRGRETKKDERRRRREKKERERGESRLEKGNDEEMMMMMLDKRMTPITASTRKKWPKQKGETADHDGSSGGEEGGASNQNFYQNERTKRGNLREKERERETGILWAYLGVM